VLRNGLGCPRCCRASFRHRSRHPTTTRQFL